MTITNNLVQWHADRGEWTITHDTSEGVRISELESWAADQPELSSQSLTLSAMNYTAHWVAMPGVKARHVARALPFALEDTLIGDLSDYTIVSAGSASGRYRAYVVETDLIDRLLELLSIHHLRLISLAPETALLGSSQSLIAYDNNDWLVSIAGCFEGRVPEAAMPAMLDYVCTKSMDTELHIYADSRDQGTLLQTTIITGYPDAFTSIDVASTTPSKTDTSVDLLQGKMSLVSSEASPPAWWRNIAVFAACFCIFAAGYLLIVNHKLENRVEQVSEASLALYKSWFPGARTSGYETVFRRMLKSGDTNAGSADFTGIMSEVAMAWGSSSKNAVEVINIRFSNRMGELLLDVSAKEQADLQTFKQALEKRGLQAEISSATADKGRIKGRVKIGGAA